MLPAVPYPVGVWRPPSYHRWFPVPVEAMGFRLLLEFRCIPASYYSGCIYFQLHLLLVLLLLEFRCIFPPLAVSSQVVSIYVLRPSVPAWSCVCGFVYFFSVMIITCFFRFVCVWIRERGGGFACMRVRVNVNV